MVTNPPSRAGQTLTGDDFSAQANQTAQEGIAAIRTVHSYSMEGQVAGIYRGLLLGPYKASKRASQIAGASFALSQFIQFAVYSLAFWCAPRMCLPPALTANAARAAPMCSTLCCSLVSAYYPRRDALAPCHDGRASCQRLCQCLLWTLRHGLWAEDRGCGKRRGRVS